MSMTANIHRVDKVEALSSNGTTWLRLSAENGNYVSVFMPFGTAKAMADAWESANAPAQKVAAE